MHLFEVWFHNDIPFSRMYIVTGSISEAIAAASGRGLVCEVKQLTFHAYGGKDLILPVHHVTSLPPEEVAKIKAEFEASFQSPANHGNIFGVASAVTLAKLQEGIDYLIAAQRKRDEEVIRISEGIGKVMARATEPIPTPEAFSLPERPKEGRSAPVKDEVKEEAPPSGAKSFRTYSDFISSVSSTGIASIPIDHGTIPSTTVKEVPVVEEATEKVVARMNFYRVEYVGDGWRYSQEVIATSTTEAAKKVEPRVPTGWRHRDVVWLRTAD